MSKGRHVIKGVFRRCFATFPHFVTHYFLLHYRDMAYSK